MIAGGGSVGRFIAEQLASSGHQVTVVDSEPDVVARYSASIEGVRWLKGDGCDFGTLKAACWKMLVSSVILTRCSSLIGGSSGNLLPTVHPPKLLRGVVAWSARARWNVST